MSIFSPRNFISPLTNTVNLVAIILLILLFAVFRFSAGRMNAELKNSAVSPKRQEPSQVEGVVPQSTSAVALPPSATGAEPVSPAPPTAAGDSDLKSEIEALTRGTQRDGTKSG